MNERVLSLLSMCMQAKEKGHHVFFDYSPHVDTGEIYIKVYKNGWREDGSSDKIFSVSISGKVGLMESSFDEVEAYLKELIGGNITVRNVRKARSRKMDKQAQWDIETLQKTIGVIPYEEMERDAIERAIKALEKQVPQKVKKYKRLNETACPECGIAFGSYEYDDEKLDYCYNCGQKLDWESEVEKDNCKGSRYFRSQWIRVNCPHWESEAEHDG